MFSRKALFYVCGFVLIAALGGAVTFAVKNYFFPLENAALVSVSNPSCVGEGREDFACFDVFYTDLVNREGITAAFLDLKTRYASSTAVVNECHQLTHVIGRAGSALSAGVGDAFAKGDAMCWSGYYHGVMEEILDEVGLEELPEKLNTVCSDIPGKSEYSFSYYNCVHGLGHGIMQLYEDDVPQSLAMCETLDGSWEQSSCYGGVFMENIMIAERGGISDYLKKEDPEYPCNAIEGKYKNDCYTMQTSYMLHAYEEDFTKVFATCDTVLYEYRGTCYQSLGRDASGRSISDAEKTKATCMLGRDTFAQENCIVGAVKDFISYFHSDVEVKELCAILRPDLGKVCSEVTEAYYATF